MASELIFPLTWHGRIVVWYGTCSPQDLSSVVESFDLSCQIEAGRRSSAGSYQTYGISIRFADRDTMRRVIEALEALDGVKMVL